MIRRLTAVLLGLALAQTSWADDGWTTAGEVLTVSLPLTALTATFTLDDPQGRSSLVTSYGLAMSAAYVLQRSVERERPDGTDDLSFPSMHATSAFSGAAFLQRRYGWDVGLPAYLSASYVGWSRVNAEKHYVSDVLASAALAWSLNHWLVPESDAGQFAVMPTEGGLALAFGYRF